MRDRTTEHAQSLLETFGIATEPEKIVCCAAWHAQLDPFGDAHLTGSLRYLLAACLPVGQHPGVLASAATLHRNDRVFGCCRYASEPARHNGKRLAVVR